jgi:hypothetical protein
MGPNVGDITYPRFIRGIRIKLTLQYVVSNLAYFTALDMATFIANLGLNLVITHDLGNTMYATGFSLIPKVTMYPWASIGPTASDVAFTYSF